MSGPSIPHTTPGVWPEAIDPGRFAAHAHRAVLTGCRVGLIGLPDDLGVRLNNGRPGAREGPNAFRAALARYGAAHPHGWEWPRVFDVGNVTPATGHNEAALQETHRRVTEAVRAVLELGLFPIAIGGGHDLTFPFVRAVAERHKKLAGIYFDAHLDVRETAGSGMAFRKLIEECGVGQLTVHGASAVANSRAHWEWFLANGGVVGKGDAPEAPLGADTFVSFDLDVLDGGVAPGVSAMNPCGWDVARAAAWVEALGGDPRVRCFDLMELNPRHDAEGRTARVAAHLFLSFLRGYARRQGGA